MNQQVNNTEYEFLWKLLANPADPNHSYIFNLQSLVTDFPQSGLLRALLMPNGDKRHIKHAAAYFNPRVLHKLNTAPDSLAKVSQDQIIFSDEPETELVDTYTAPAAEPFVPPVTEQSEASYTPVVEESAETEAQAPDTSYSTFVEPETVADNNFEEELIVDASRENILAYIEEDERPVQNTDRVATYNQQDLEPYDFGQVEGTPIDEEPVHEEIAEAPIVEPVETSDAETEEIVEAPIDEHAETPAVELTEATFGEEAETIEEITEQPEITEEDSFAKQYDAYLTESEAAPSHPVSSYDDGGDRYFHQPIEDEVYDEIVSIEDIGLEQLAILNKSAQNGEDENFFVFEPEEIAEAAPAPVEVAEPVAEETVEHEPVEEAAELVAVDEEIETAPVQEPEQQVSQPTFAEPVAMHPAVVTEQTAAQHSSTIADEKSDVSMYNDSKMPYSFLWWLDKTRKEHADIYQPYASQAEPQPEPAPAQEAPKKPEPLDELQKQYYQNIVSTTSIAELDKNPPKAPLNAQPRKEHKIIERFIHEEPQIKHPTEVKLDSENKAKRSSEDKEELVTETLARIYTEQMLYHKAILTYKKLMLKYPEKSLYFAGQIEQLESKIN